MTDTWNLAVAECTRLIAWTDDLIRQAERWTT